MSETNAIGLPALPSEFWPEIALAGNEVGPWKSWLRMNINQTTVFLLIAFTVRIGPARADDWSFTQHPVKTIIITRQKPENIVTVFSPSQTQQDLKIISNNFASAGYDVPKVLPFSLQSFQTDIEALGTSLAVSSSDLALPDDKTLSISLLQNQSRDHPSRCDDVCSVSTVTKKCGELAA